LINKDHHMQKRYVIACRCKAVKLVEWLNYKNTLKFERWICCAHVETLHLKNLMKTYVIVSSTSGSFPEKLYSQQLQSSSANHWWLNNIIGKKLISFKLVVRTRRSYKRVWLIKQKKSFQGLAMYGHEVFDVLTKASKVFRDTLFSFHVSDNRLYQITAWFMEKRRHHCQTSSFSSDFDDVSFPCSNHSKLCFSFWVSPG
jgi:hypothetical protein